MRRRWFELIMGLAAIHPAPSAAASTTRSQSTFYINKPASSSETNGAVAPRPQVINAPRASAEHKLIFDTSDARRSLDDWELEDYVLVATIEGSLYALDRHSGVTKWVLEGGGPAVRSMGSEHPDPETVNTTKEAWATEQQPRWIVQPVEGGQLFLFDPDFGVLVLKPMTALTTGTAINNQAVDRSRAIQNPRRR
jgi:hypothetical protein